MNSQKTHLKDLIKFIYYDAYNGELYSLSKGDPPRPERKLQPNEDNKITSTIHGCSLKIKADRLIWYIVYGKQPNRNQVIFHKNLDDLDNSLNNLIILPKKEYLRLVEAMKNISGALRMIPHSSDAFSYVLTYKMNGRTQREVVQDITIARRKFNKLQLKFVKLISKYTVSD